MKRNAWLAILLSLVMLVGILSLTACDKTTPDSKTDSTTASDDAVEDTGTVSSQTSAKTYTYKVRAMQGVDNCIYYAAGTEIPNSDGRIATGETIYVWTKCTTCGDDGEQYRYNISVDELNFSNGNTTQYVGTDQCWDCKWEKGLESFMWAVEITRIEVE